MVSLKCVILGAGYGKRLRPLTNTRSKLLLPIANKPIIQHIIDTFVTEGIYEFVIVIGHDLDGLRSYFSKNSQDIKIEYVIQDTIDGTASAVGVVSSHVKGSFVVVNGDMLFDSTFLRLILHKGGVSMAVSYVEDPTQYGTVDVEGGYITSISEKNPKVQSHLANVGIYLLRDEIFSAISKTKKSPRGEYELTDSLLQLIRGGKKISAVECSSWWRDIGRPWDILDANEHYLSILSNSFILGIIEDGATILGPIQLGRGSIIYSGAKVFGPCIIGENSIIRNNSVIRSFTTIGDNCSIGPHTEIRNSLLMSDVVVSEHSTIFESIIDEHVTIGSGCTISSERDDKKTIEMEINGVLLDSKRERLGAVIGSNVTIDKNVVIYPGRKIDSGENIVSLKTKS